MSLKKFSRILLTAMAVWALAGRAADAGVPAEFDAANRLYAEGKFVEAAGAYEKLIQSGAVSPALYFNYGNAEFKSGHLGRAIAAYRRAERWAPRDAEVRANLEFARNQVQGPTLRPNRWADWLGTLALNEWTGLAATALWLLFALLTAGQIRPALKPMLRGWTWVTAAVAIFLGAGAGLAAALHFSRPTVVVIAADTALRSGPFDEAQSAFTAHDGAELSVLDSRDNWLQVTDGSGRIGWLQLKQVEILPGS
jgi:tetratricopeptide (TPR) repeat protein